MSCHHPCAPVRALDPPQNWPLLGPEQVRKGERQNRVKPAPPPQVLIRGTDNEEGNRNGGGGGRGKVGLRNQRICKGSGDFELKLYKKAI